MIQALLVGLLFTAASFYLGRMVYLSLQAKSCASGCGKCATLDVDAIEKKIRVNNPSA
jgi:hypothetical protein